MTRSSSILEYGFPAYMRQVIGIQNPEAYFFVATEKDFTKDDVLVFPYRSHFYCVALMHRGACRLKIGFNDYQIEDHCLTLVGPGIVRQWLENDWKAINHTIFFTSEFFSESINTEFLKRYTFFKPGAKHVLPLIDSDYEQATQFTEIISRNKSKSSIAQGLLYAYLQWINGVYNIITRGVSGNSRNQQLCNNFAVLLSKHYTTHKDLGFYAKQLHVSEKQLSDVLRKETGLSAKQSIDTYLLMEAKSLLKQTPLTVKEISYQLGYEDPAYFTRMFKEKEGVTPSAYRNL